MARGVRVKGSGLAGRAGGCGRSCAWKGSSGSGLGNGATLAPLRLTAAACGRQPCVRRHHGRRLELRVASQKAWTCRFAVLCCFAEKAGVAREFPFAFLLTLAPRACRRDLHACFQSTIPGPLSIAASLPFFSPDNAWMQFLHRTLPQSLASSSSCTHASQPRAQVETKHCSCSNAIVAHEKRPTATLVGSRGSEEAWSALDVAWAKGEGRAQPSDRKAQHCYLQNTQKSNNFGLLSSFVPTMILVLLCITQAVPESHPRILGQAPDRLPVWRHSCGSKSAREE